MISFFIIILIISLIIYDILTKIYEILDPQYYPFGLLMPGSFEKPIALFQDYCLCGTPGEVRASINGTIKLCVYSTFKISFMFILY
jgi:hypothetical protein